MYEDARALLDSSGLSIQDRARTIEAAHGRIETREAHLVTDLVRLQEQHHWPGLACIGKLTATREDKASGTAQIQSRYYLLSRVMSAQEFLDAVHAH